jgi:hypothetical protein
MGMEMVQERLLGFDAREPESAAGSRWDEARRQRFLLRVDAPLPLSVDDTVWPSLFDSGQGIGLPPGEREQLGLAGLPLPSWVGPNTGLWEDLFRLRQQLAAGGPAARPYVIVAVSWVSDDGFANAGSVGPYLDTTSPESLDPGWRLLGFDVADGSRLSGLANCGYAPEEAPGLRAQWAKELNENHLFADAHSALRFRDLADARVKEHAPFFVYGLYLVGNV